MPSQAIGVQSYRSLELMTPYSLRAVLRLGRYIRHECAVNDVIHAHLFPTMLYASLAVRAVGWRGKLVCTEHSTDNGRRGRLLGRTIDTVLYSRYDRVACISRGTRDALAAWMPALTAKLDVIENGVPLSNAEAPVRRPTERPVIVSVGRLSRPKNYDTALRAMALLQDQPCEYHIAGSGPEESDLKRLCAQLRVDDRVRFLGFVDDVSELLRKSDIFLMPSRWEGFGLAAVEAMNAGLPVVASDVEGLREIVAASPPCGIFVDPSDAEAIAHALRVLLLDPEKRRSYGQAAHRRSQEFSIDLMVERYMEFYKSL